MTDKLKRILEILPEKPGVYIMKDENLRIIYVGKAINLKNRVRQYFQTSNGHSEKTILMVSRICDIKYIVTGSEMEALILENNLIKAHKPKFNILLKDDKNYPFIKVTLKEKFPRVLITRSLKKDGSKYFGPYSKISLLKETLKILKDIFPIRTCKKDLHKISERPCLNYFIKKCAGPCNGKITIEEYSEIIHQVCEFLSGKYGNLVEDLRNKMYEASNIMDFEIAAVYRDKIDGLNHLLEKQRVVTNSSLDQDVIACAKDEKDVLIVVFFVRGGLLIGSSDYVFRNESSSNLSEVVLSFVKQYYSEENYIPKNIILEYKLDESKLIEELLTEKKGYKVSLIVPQKGDKLNYLKMAKLNAIITLKKKIELDINNINMIKFMEKIKEMLGLVKIPRRIEAYDISNTGVTEIVGSMVVIEDGKENKKEYRRFKIKSKLDKPNDYLAMQEVLFRRFKRLLNSSDSVNGDDRDSFNKMPDLILLDGGKGHISAVKEVIKELGIEVPIYGMVKDSKHKTRAIATLTSEINISEDMEVFRFFTKIQNEVHRFTIDYNKVLRIKRYRESALDKIEGIGPKKKNELLKFFGSINKLKAAKINELLEVKGISEDLARKIYEYFRSI